MKVLVIQGAALLLLMAALPLISRGATGSDPAVWGVGLGALVVGGLLPVVTRFLGRDEPEKARDCGMEHDERTS